MGLIFFLMFLFLKIIFFFFYLKKHGYNYNWSTIVVCWDRKWKNVCYAGNHPKGMNNWFICHLQLSNMFCCNVYPENCCFSFYNLTLFFFFFNFFFFYFHFQSLFYFYLWPFFILSSKILSFPVYKIFSLSWWFHL